MCSGLSESEDGGRFRAKGGSCFRAKDGSHCSHLETPKGTPFPGVSFLFVHVQHHDLDDVSDGERLGRMPEEAV